MGNKDALALLTPEQAAALPEIIQQMMSPIVEAMGKMLQHNAEALEQLAGAQKVQNDRLEALEKRTRQLEEQIQKQND